MYHFATAKEVVENAQIKNFTVFIGNLKTLVKNRTLYMLI